MLAASENFCCCCCSVCLFLIALRTADPYCRAGGFVFSETEVAEVSFAGLSMSEWWLSRTSLASVLVDGVEPSVEGDDSHCRDRWNRRAGVGSGKRRRAMSRQERRRTMGSRACCIDKYIQGTIRQGVNRERMAAMEVKGRLRKSKLRQFPSRLRGSDNIT
jgi:hypothetical protein